MTVALDLAESPVKQYEIVAQGIAEQEQLYSSLGLTAELLESELTKPAYKATLFLPFEKKLTASQKNQIATVEKITGFGSVLGEAFEELLTDFGRLPTQSEYVTYSTDKIKQWWTGDNRRTEGVLWSDIVEQAVINRQLRSYSSHLVELHSLLTIRELFPEWTVYCSNDIDLLMGVDLVIETEQKRLYLHVFKNSQSGFLAFHKKEKRGGRRDSKGKFHKFKRDFTGDKTLQYDWRENSCSESTQFINGNVLFKSEYLELQLTMFDRFKQFGEALTDTPKFDYLEQFLQELEEVKCN